MYKSRKRSIGGVRAEESSITDLIICVNYAATDGCSAGDDIVLDIFKRSFILRRVSIFHDGFMALLEIVLKLPLKGLKLKPE